MVDLDKFVADCREALKSRDPASVVEGLVREVIADPEALDAAFAARIKGPSLQDRMIVNDDNFIIGVVGFEYRTKASADAVSTVITGDDNRYKVIHNVKLPFGRYSIK